VAQTLQDEHQGTVKRFTELTAASTAQSTIAEEKPKVTLKNQTITYFSNNFEKIDKEKI